LSNRLASATIGAFVQRVRIGLVYEDTALFAVPNHLAHIYVKQAFTAIGENSTAKTLPTKPERGDQRGRQREGRRVTRIDHRFDFAFLSSRSSNLQADVGENGSGADST